MYDFLGRVVTTHPWKICAAWLVLAVGVTLVAPSLSGRTQDDDIRHLPARCASVRGYGLLEKAFPQDVFASRVIFAVERPGSGLSPADLKLVDQIAERLEKLSRDEPALQIGNVVSRRDRVVGGRLTSGDGQCSLIQLLLGTPYLATTTRDTVDKAEAAAKELLVAAGPDAPTLHVTGPAGIGRDLCKAGGDSLDRTTIATVILVVVVLLAVYRSPTLALVPLVTIAVSSWVALELLALASLIPGVHIVNTSQVFTIVILFGAGTDYCLFLISRYREELERGRALPTALRNSVSKVGEALIASAGTVICGLGMMGFAEFAKVRSAGPVIALALAVGVTAALTLTPAILKLCGAWAFWPAPVAVRIPGQKRRRTLWAKISRYVVNHPAGVFITSGLVLLPFAALGFWVKPGFSPIGDLSPSAGSVRGLEAIQTHFTAGETGPTTILLAADADWNSPAGRGLIRHLSDGFGRLDNVAEVRSLTQPLGKPLPDFAPAPATTGLLGNLLGGRNPLAEIAAKATEQANKHYLAALPTGPGKFVTRLDVVFKSDPFSAESVATLGTLELWLKDLLPPRAAAFATVRPEVYGVTVSTRDMATVIERDRTKVNALVLAGVFLILLVLVKRLWLATYLLATVLLSYYATLGLTTLFATFYDGRPLGQIEWRVPFFLFTILVAVGEDYNILMVTRALQEKKKHGAKEGIRRGLARTGGTITACGLIMAGTFATLTLAGLGTLVQIGFALGVGVLLDTFLVRPFLVPSFMLLVWQDDDVPLPQSARPHIRDFQMLRRAG